MLEFTPMTIAHEDLLRKYYSQCTYRLCEYSLGVKLMWKDHWKPEFAESNGCLVVLNHSSHYGIMFDFPIPLLGEGDVDAALDDIDAWCVEHSAAPSYGVVPENERERLMKRYRSLPDAITPDRETTSTSSRSSTPAPSIGS